MEYSHGHQQTNVGSQSTSWVKCRPCRGEMVGTVLVLDQVSSTQTPAVISTAARVLGPEVALARIPNYSVIKTKICCQTLAIQEYGSDLVEADDMHF
jgi:hypothetical protein